MFSVGSKYFSRARESEKSIETAKFFCKKYKSSNEKSRQVPICESLSLATFTFHLNKAFSVDRKTRESVEAKGE